MQLCALKRFFLSIVRPASPKPSAASSQPAQATNTHVSPGMSNVVPPRQQKPGAKSKAKKKKKGTGW